MRNCSVSGSIGRDNSDLALAIQLAQPTGIINEISVANFLDTTGGNYATRGGVVLGVVGHRSASDFNTPDKVTKARFPRDQVVTELT